jgi:hypothetical protein
VFWKSLRESTEQDKLLSLNEGYFFGTPSFGNKIFLRSCYDDLVDAIRKELDNGKRGIIISGNPGAKKISCWHAQSERLTELDFSTQA